MHISGPQSHASSPQQHWLQRFIFEHAHVNDKVWMTLTAQPAPHVKGEVGAKSALDS